MVSIASTLLDFTPALGHTYLPLTQTPGTDLQASQSSRSGTPLQPTGTPKPQTQDSSSSKGTTASKLTAYEDIQGTQLLEASYELLLRYGNEYMDENPLIGEPGSFKLSKTRESGLGAVSAASKNGNQPFKATGTPKKALSHQIETNLPNDGTKKANAGSAKSPNTPGMKRKKERRKSKAAGTDEVSTPKPSTPQTAT